MRPLAVLIAIVFGSATAISFGLIATGIVFLVLKNDHPELSRELLPLLVSCAWFVGLAGISGGALFATLKQLGWQRYAQLAMVLAIVAVSSVYWPSV